MRIFRTVAVGAAHRLGVVHCHLIPPHRGWLPMPHDGAYAILGREKSLSWYNEQQAQSMSKQQGEPDRDDLAAFLRSRRERLSPAQVGLPTTPRRRTPGLRREEVAQLAGVGVTWYTWLEQGREIRVSAHFLERVASALRL